MSVPGPPEGVQAPGSALWESVVGDFELSEPELVLLVQACRTADTCEALQQIVDVDGPMAGDRPHPALVELRMQRLVLGRLIAALRVPTGEAGDEQPGRLQRRSGFRGVYVKGGLA